MTVVIIVAVRIGMMRVMTTVVPIPSATRIEALLAMKDQEIHTKRVKRRHEHTG